MYESVTARGFMLRACVAALAVLSACGDTTTTRPIAAESASRSLADGAATVGGVFVTTNATSGNAVVAFARASDGSLTPTGTFSTGGAGTGGTLDPLASQSAVALSDDHKRLYVVNAGSNSISTFAVSGGTLSPLGTVPSAGTLPVSLTVSRNALFVLNAGSNAVAEFALGADGTPAAAPVATASLGTPASGASTISASRDGRFVLVTERNANAIDVFAVSPNGALSAPVTTHSSGATPFGFGFTPRGQAVVSEASGAVSSYGLNADGSLSLVSASVSTHQAATCWLVVSNDGRFAFAVNSASGSISAYRVEADGSLQILSADGRTGVTGDGTAPIDLGLSHDGKFLYVLNAGAGTIAAFGVERDGGLASLPGATGVVAPASGSQGLAAY
jgi:6-phosphogluconolactonase (cycloisomerase 2 family)